jgi:hypothetical protein
MHCAAVAAGERLSRVGGERGGQPAQPGPVHPADAHAASPAAAAAQRAPHSAMIAPTPQPVPQRPAAATPPPQAPRHGTTSGAQPVATGWLVHAAAFHPHAAHAPAYGTHPSPAAYAAAPALLPGHPHAHELMASYAGHPAASAHAPLALAMPAAPLVPSGPPSLGQLSPGSAAYAMGVGGYPPSFVTPGCMAAAYVDPGARGSLADAAACGGVAAAGEAADMSCSPSSSPGGGARRRSLLSGFLRSLATARRVY